MEGVFDMHFTGRNLLTVLAALAFSLAGRTIVAQSLDGAWEITAVIDDGRVVLENPGPYGGPYVYQQFYRAADFDGNHPIIGSWIVNGYACGIGIREDTSLVTGNTSRFVPHLFGN